MRTSLRKFSSGAAIAFGVAALSSALVAGPAHAETATIPATAARVLEQLNSGSDPQATYLALSASDRAAFDSYMLPASSTESVSMTPANDAARKAMTERHVDRTYTSLADAQRASASTQGCWNATVRWTEKAGFGNAIWDTYTDGTWCASGSTVTGATFNRSWSTIAAAGWRDGGQVGKGSGVVSNRARIWSQRKMILGAGGWDVQTRTPCVRLNGTAGGSPSFTASCSLN